MSKLERKLIPTLEGQVELLVEGTGPRIVLLPSLARGATDFDEIAPIIAAAGFRVLRPQPRGIGASFGPTEGITLIDLAADVAAAVEADCAPGKPEILCVAGHAFGNWVARVLANHWPRMTKSVALLAAIIDDTISPELLISVNVVSDNAKPDADRLFYLTRDFFAPGHDASVWLSGWHTEVTQFQLAATRATADSSWIEVGHKLPVLYVAPEFDKIAPVPEEDFLRDRVGHLTTMEIIYGSGHALLPEKVSEAAAALVSFAQSIMRTEGSLSKST
jgi:pimeloyl-ACP methyl ester carboxylesterase